MMTCKRATFMKNIYKFFIIHFIILLFLLEIGAQLINLNQYDSGKNSNSLLQQQNQYSRDFGRDRYENRLQTVQLGEQNENFPFNKNMRRFEYSRGSNYQSSNRFLKNFEYEEENENDFCPEYWLSFRQTCYRFVKSPKREWIECKKICEAYGANLINIDSMDKQTFITKQLYLENRVENKYFISARQTSPKNWVNEDNTQLFIAEDSFSFEEPEIGDENFDHWSIHNDNRIITTNNRNRYSNSNSNSNSKNNNSPNTFNFFDNHDSQRDRVVYGYSRKKDRWMLMPAYDFEANLFICESQNLYNPENIEKRIESRRKIDYGVDVIDPERLPRGPFFVKQPKDTTYDTGKKEITNYVTMQCLAGGFPTPTYTWYKEEYINDNLTYIKTDPLENSRYTVSGGNLIVHYPDQSKDQGSYHCVAENKFGRIISESVQLNFGYILEFNLKRADEPGDMHWGKALFCDPPTHYPGVKYYWALDYFPNFVDEDERTFVSYDGALYISALESIDRGSYSCNVQSLVSDTGKNGPFFDLDVRPHPNYQALIFSNSFPKVFPEAPIAGEDIRLECVAFGYPYPTYNWTRRDGNLPKNSRIENFNRVLIIKNATVNDNGEYICTIKNDEKKSHKSVFINVQMYPNFTIPLRDQVKDYNSEANFICEAAAIPDANYTWYKNAELLDRDKLDRDKYIIQDNMLTIKYLDPEKDDGMYQCKATNQLKGVYTSAQLRVLSIKPSFKKRPLESEIYAVQNGNTTIVCDPEAAPRPKFQWKKDGNIINFGGNKRMLSSGTLIISPTLREDAGIYTCVATNAHGSDQSTAVLIVFDEMRFYQNFQPQIISEIGKYLYLQCDVYHNSLLDIAFIWTHNGQVINNYADDYVEFQGQTNERYLINYNSLQISNLSIFDSGEYECTAKSAVNQISTQTELLVLGPPGKPGGVRIIDIKKTEAELEWVDGASNGRPIIYYNILARMNWNKTWVVIAEGIEAYDYDRYSGRKRAKIENLTPYCAYEFSVAAVNDLGIGPPSAPSPSHNTLHDKPYIAPSNIDGGGGKIGDLTITWDPLLPEEQNSVGIHYKIYWRLHGKIGETEWASRVLKKYGNIGKAVVQIPFDNYYTKYDVMVQAINDQGEGPRSNVSVIYSAEDMPQVAPQGVISSAYNSTAINVTWNPVEQTRKHIRGELIGYRLKYWIAGRNEEDAIYSLSRTTRNWALIVGLEVDSYYFVKVMAYNTAGEGPESERFMESTYRAAPQKPPSSVHVYGVNPSTIRVVWRYVSPSQEEEPIKGYKIRIWEAEQDMATANDIIVLVGNKLEATIDTLVPGKAYKLRILAYSNGGDGRMSSPVITFQMGITKSPYNSAMTTYANKLLLIFISFAYFLYVVD